MQSLIVPGGRAWAANGSGKTIRSVQVAPRQISKKAALQYSQPVLSGRYSTFLFASPQLEEVKIDKKDLFVDTRKDARTKAKESKIQTTIIFPPARNMRIQHYLHLNVVAQRKTC